MIHSSKLLFNPWKFMWNSGFIFLLLFFFFSSFTLYFYLKLSSNNVWNKIKKTKDAKILDDIKFSSYKSHLRIYKFLSPKRDRLHKWMDGLWMCVCVRSYVYSHNTNHQETNSINFVTIVNLLSFYYCTFSFFLLLLLEKGKYWSFLRNTMCTCLCM